MIFKESEIAHKYLDGLKGIEIGAAYHNPFGLDTINVSLPTAQQYIDEQMSYCWHVAKVDVIANGDDLPFDDESFDFVISSHVFEHFANPIKALEEWERVARKYIFMIVPHKDRTFDRDRALTDIREVKMAWLGNRPNIEDKHHYAWTPANMDELMKWFCKVTPYTYQIIDPDDKVGNGFMVIIELNKNE
jgi:ubiquinone/menaquinone biosynthesis C-methylase UbiE